MTEKIDLIKRFIDFYDNKNPIDELIAMTLNHILESYPSLLAREILKTKKKEKFGNFLSGIMIVILKDMVQAISEAVEEFEEEDKNE